MLRKRLQKTSQNLSVILGPDENLADYYIFENIIQNIVVGVRAVWLVGRLNLLFATFSHKQIFQLTGITMLNFCSGDCCINKDKAKLSSAQNIGYV